jgi:hypothetical protein
VREIDNGLCAYCHTPEALTVTTFEIDHINRPQMIRLRGLWIKMGLLPPN